MFQGPSAVPVLCDWQAVRRRQSISTAGEPAAEARAVSEHTYFRIFYFINIILLEQEVLFL